MECESALGGVQRGAGGAVRRFVSGCMHSVVDWMADISARGEDSVCPDPRCGGDLFRGWPDAVLGRAGSSGVDSRAGGGAAKVERGVAGGWSGAVGIHRRSSAGECVWAGRAGSSGTCTSLAHVGSNARGDDGAARECRCDLLFCGAALCDLEMETQACVSELSGLLPENAAVPELFFKGPF